jgi:fructuronate reductase
MIPLVFAGWLRYLTGYDDEGNPMEKSPDPGIEIAEPYMAKNPYGSGIKDRDAILELLSKKEIFGADLNKAGLSEKVLGYFEEMNSTPGSVRAVLKKYVNESV